MRRYTILAVLLGVISCKTDNVSPLLENDSNAGYPSTVTKPRRAEVSRGFYFYESRLSTFIRANVDSFGFIGHLGGLWRGRSGISDAGQAIRLAKSALLVLRDRTCVFDTSLIEVRSAQKYRSGPLPLSDWEIHFGPQIYNGLEVWNSDILVLIADSLVQMEGHWYRHVTVPYQNTISKERAKSLLLGSVIQYQCWGPSTFLVTDSSISIDSIRQCIYPLVESDRIELRVVWKVPISDMWYYFVDILTGERVALIERFIC